MKIINKKYKIFVLIFICNIRWGIGNGKMKMFFMNWCNLFIFLKFGKIVLVDFDFYDRCDFGGGGRSWKLNE